MWRERVVVIHLTEKLRRKLHVPPLGHTGVEAPAHLRWYAIVFTAQRTQYLLATNAASLYSVVWYGRGITDDSDFMLGFLQRLKEQMRGDGLGFIFERCIQPHGHSVSLLKTEDRSVLGSMNDMVTCSKYTLAAADLSPDELSAHINGTPYGALGYGIPRDVLSKLPVEGSRGRGSQTLE